MKRHNPETYPADTRSIGSMSDFAANGLVR